MPRLKVMCPISVQVVTNLSPTLLFTIHPNRNEAAPRYLSRAGVAASMAAPGRQPRGRGERRGGGHGKNVFVGARVLRPLMLAIRANWERPPSKFCTW